MDCGLQVMKEHCYWPLVSDLNNVLSHRPVAVKFMSDDALLEMWFTFLSMFQGQCFVRKQNYNDSRGKTAVSKRCVCVHVCVCHVRMK